ncbi:MAG: tyrosine-type recombinase/integrase, partial [Actinophytocola sp.]|nr:tyrosine-type recombinase/integrase [Actinophytocola sp.]
MVEEEIEVSPMSGIKPPIVPEQPVPVVSSDAIKRVLATCKGKGFVARRDEAIIRVFYDTGVRLSEILVDVEAFDLNTDTVGVLGKGRKLRTVPFSATTGR